MGARGGPAVRAWLLSDRFYWGRIRNGSVTTAARSLRWEKKGERVIRAAELNVSSTRFRRYEREERGAVIVVYQPAAPEGLLQWHLSGRFSCSN